MIGSATVNVGDIASQSSVRIAVGARLGVGRRDGLEVRIRDGTGAAAGGGCRQRQAAGAGVARSLRKPERSQAQNTQSK